MQLTRSRCLATSFAASARVSDAVTTYLLNASYYQTRELYPDVNAAFKTKWAGDLAGADPLWLT